MRIGLRILMLSAGALPNLAHSQSLHGNLCRLVFSRSAEATRELPVPRMRANKLGTPPKADGQYLWDNWGIYDRRYGIHHRYFLAASRSVAVEQRHAVAYIRHFTSKDGLNWSDAGPILVSGHRPGPMWSGDIIITQQGTFSLLYTTVERKPDGSLGQQRIVMATSMDGHNFVRTPKPVLIPQNVLNYHIEEGDGITMAWRDPFWFESKDGNIFILFATKAELAHSGRIVPAVGVALARNQNLHDLQLMPAIVLPEDRIHPYTQIEVPNIYYDKNHRLHLVVSTTNRSSDTQSDDSVETSIRMYIADDLYSRWTPINSNGGIFINSQQKGFAWHLYRGLEALAATLFFTKGHSHSLLGTPYFQFSY